MTESNYPEIKLHAVNNRGLETKLQYELHIVTVYLIVSGGQWENRNMIDKPKAMLSFTYFLYLYVRLWLPSMPVLLLLNASCDRCLFTHQYILIILVKLRVVFCFRQYFTPCLLYTSEVASWQTYIFDMVFSLQIIWITM